VCQRTADRPLRHCIIALAAYGVALSGLVGSYGLARAAAATAAVPSGIICHTILEADQAPSPAPDPTDHCADNCCVGCITLLVSLPPPPTTVVGALQSLWQRISPPAHVTLAARPETASCRSRAPPSAA
jgi:hypothetical protein